MPRNQCRTNLSDSIETVFFVKCVITLWLTPAVSTVAPQRKNSALVRKTMLIDTDNRFVSEPHTSLDDKTG